MKSKFQYLMTVALTFFSGYSMGKSLDYFWLIGLILIIVMDLGYWEN